MPALWCTIVHHARQSTTFAPEVALSAKLRIPTIVITDIDPVEVKTGAKGQPIRVAVANTGQAGLECGNARATGTRSS